MTPAHSISTLAPVDTRAATTTVERAGGKQAVRKAEASAVAAKKTVQAGEKAVESAAGKIG
jgi:hypothetical protein